MIPISLDARVLSNTLAGGLLRWLEYTNAQNCELTRESPFKAFRTYLVTVR